MEICEGEGDGGLVRAGEWGMRNEGGLGTEGGTRGGTDLVQEEGFFGGGDEVGDVVGCWGQGGDGCVLEGAR